MSEIPGPNTPRRRKRLLAMQGGVARVTFQHLTGCSQMPDTFPDAQKIAARFPGRITAQVDYRRRARRKLLLYADGSLVLSYPIGVQAYGTGDGPEPIG